MVTVIDTSNASSFVLTGTGFDAIAENNLVKLGDVACDITDATSTQLTCKPGLVPVGTYDFSVNVKNKGYALINSSVTNFTFVLVASSINPTTSGTGG